RSAASGASPEACAASDRAFRPDHAVTSTRRAPPPGDGGAVATDELMSHRSSRMSRHPLCSSPRATYGRTADSGVPGGNLSADAHQRHREANARDHYLELLKRALLGELSAPADNLVPIGRARRA